MSIFVSERTKVILIIVNRKQKKKVLEISFYLYTQNVFSDKRKL